MGGQTPHQKRHLVPTSGMTRGPLPRSARTSVNGDEEAVAPKKVEISQNTLDVKKTLDMGWSSDRDGFI